MPKHSWENECSTSIKERLPKKEVAILDIHKKDDIYQVRLDGEQYEELKKKAGYYDNLRTHQYSHRALHNELTNMGLFVLAGYINDSMNWKSHQCTPESLNEELAREYMKIKTKYDILVTQSMMMTPDIHLLQKVDRIERFLSQLQSFQNFM